MEEIRDAVDSLEKTTARPSLYDFVAGHHLLLLGSLVAAVAVMVGKKSSPSWCSMV